MRDDVTENIHLLCKGKYHYTAVVSLTALDSTKQKIR